MPSLHNTLFFKSCRNYTDENDRITIHGSSVIVPEMCDNDYNTFSSEADVDVNVADAGGNATRVDVVFIKSKGVSHHTGIPSGGSGNGWTSHSVPDRIQNFEGRDVPTTVDGFQHDLYLLDMPFTATDVRLQFTGANIEIYEVMLLEFVYELDANAYFRRMNFQKVDRTGRLQEGTKRKCASSAVAWCRTLEMGRVV